MSDNGEVEVDTTSGFMPLPKDVTQEIGTVKLFNKWSYEDVEPENRKETKMREEKSQTVAIYFNRNLRKR
ncbi:MAG: hypothetical protein Q9190_007550 [Brigantiaea leucoxantha]